MATRSMREAPPCRWIAFCSLYYGGNFFERSDNVGIEVNESPGGLGGGELCEGHWLCNTDWYLTNIEEGYPAEPSVNIAPNSAGSNIHTYRMSDCGARLKSGSYPS